MRAPSSGLLRARLAINATEKMGDTCRIFCAIGHQATASSHPNAIAAACSQVAGIFLMRTAALSASGRFVS